MVIVISHLHEMNWRDLLRVLVALLCGIFCNFRLEKRHAFLVYFCNLISRMLLM